MLVLKTLKLLFLLFHIYSMGVKTRSYVDDVQNEAPLWILTVCGNRI